MCGRFKGKDFLVVNVLISDLGPVIPPKVEPLVVIKSTSPIGTGINDKGVVIPGPYNRSRVVEAFHMIDPPDYISPDIWYVAKALIAV